VVEGTKSISARGRVTIRAFTQPGASDLGEDRPHGDAPRLGRLLDVDLVIQLAEIVEG
jgi:hypothetical protein